MSGAPKGLPVPGATRTTEPFWSACAEHRLIVQRCLRCGVHRHTPAPICAGCQSSEFAWDESKGTGEVYSYTIAHHPVHPSLKSQVPYAVVVVRLDDCGGVCLTSNLIDTAPERIRIGMRVRLEWVDVAEGIALPQFRSE